MKRRRSIIASVRPPPQMRRTARGRVTGKRTAETGSHFDLGWSAEDCAPRNLVGTMVRRALCLFALVCLFLFLYYCLVWFTEEMLDGKLFLFFFFQV